MKPYPVSASLLLLAEAGLKFRRYEGHHRAKNTAESLEKAEVNAEIAGRIEAFIQANAITLPPQENALLRDLLAHIDETTCTHENTRRGGIIWTICEDCDRTWADDRGGFVPHADAPAVAAARAHLDPPPPRPGEIRVIDGRECRFIERELEGDKWEIIGPVVRK